MKLLFFGTLVLAAALAVCDFGRWAWGWVRRKGWRTRAASPTQQRAWLSQAFLATVGAVALPWMYHAVLNWVTAGAAPGVRVVRNCGVLLLFGFPVSLGSLCLWTWGMVVLVRFHRSKPDLQDRPKAAASWVLAALWLILFPLSVARLLRFMLLID